MQVFIKTIRVLSDVSRYVVEAAVIIIMLLTVSDVVCRIFFNTAINGVTEYSQMLMSIILMATAYTAMGDLHIKVDIVMTALSKTVQKICIIITCGFSAVVAGLICSSAFSNAMRAMENNQTYTTLGIVKWPFFLLYAIAMGALCLATIALMLNIIVNKTIEQKGGEAHE